MVKKKTNELKWITYYHISLYSDKPSTIIWAGNLQGTKWPHTIKII